MIKKLFCGALFTLSTLTGTDLSRMEKIQEKIDLIKPLDYPKINTNLGLVTCLAYDAFNKKLFLGGSKINYDTNQKLHFIYSYDLVTGTCKPIIRVHNQVTRLAISPDGTKIAYCCFMESVFFVYETDKKESYEYRAIDNFVETFSFSPDSKKLFIGFFNGTILEYHFEQNIFKVIYKQLFPIFSIACNPTNQVGTWNDFVFGSNDQKIHFLNLSTKKHQEFPQLIKHQDTTSLAFSPSGEQIAIAYQDNTIALYNLKKIVENDGVAELILEESPISLVWISENEIVYITKITRTSHAYSVSNNKKSDSFLEIYRPPSVCYNLYHWDITTQKRTLLYDYAYIYRDIETNDTLPLCVPQQEHLLK